MRLSELADPAAGSLVLDLRVVLPSFPYSLDPTFATRDCYLLTNYRKLYNVDSAD